MVEPTIRAVVFKEGEWWVIQCLEYDLATQTRRLEDVPAVLERLVRAQIALNAERGVEPFHGFSAAPRRFWELYERARSFAAPAGMPHLEARLAA